MEREMSLGHLLEEIVTRSGEVLTTLAWTGRASLYNNRLPAMLAVNSQAPNALPLIDDGEMKKRVSALKEKYQILSLKWWSI